MAKSGFRTTPKSERIAAILAPPCVYRRLLDGQTFESRLVAAPGSQTSDGPHLAPLRQMGADIARGPKSRHREPSREVPFVAFRYRPPVASAQVKGA